MTSIKQSLFFTLLLITSLISISCQSSSTDIDIDEPTIDGAVVTFENSGSQAYLITSIEGDGVEAQLNENNPDMVIEVGMRYTIRNLAGASSHPFVLRNSDRESLLGQRNSGSFMDDPDVDVVLNGDDIIFTLTAGLASELADYVCSFHPGMNGEITVVQ